ncbi:collagen alpha-1(I) chain-like [Numida meleagris]|uniref:collagen alpha-1(I) chain-like n=1 Tax=Numida meleagris TaxID=8996 RepID=UPI000B3DF714|nr:collagen alpha-1(I) chain-like [Numida meleagris]
METSGRGEPEINLIELLMVLRMVGFHVFTNGLINWVWGWWRGEAGSGLSTTARRQPTPHIEGNTGKRSARTPRLPLGRRRFRPRGGARGLRAPPGLRHGVGSRGQRREGWCARGAVRSDVVGAGLAARHLGPCVEAAEARRRGAGSGSGLAESGSPGERGGGRSAGPPRRAPG